MVTIAERWASLGHMHDAEFPFIGKDHYRATWTFREDQKDAGTEEMTFVRTGRRESDRIKGLQEGRT